MHTHTHTLLLLLYFLCVATACFYLREVSPVSLVVLASRLALSFHDHSVTRTRMHAPTQTHTHTHTHTMLRYRTPLVPLHGNEQTESLDAAKYQKLAEGLT